MRLIKTLFIAGLGIAAAMLPSAASAQSIDRILGFVSAGSAFGYNGCGYVRKGVGRIACQASRASSVARTLRSVQYNSEQRRRQQLDRRTRQTVALQRACRAGDEQSCARSGGTDPRTRTIVRELLNACTAGDRISCSRADAMMDGRETVRPMRVLASQDRGYGRDRELDRAYPQPRWSQDDLRMLERTDGTACRPVIDPRTGYRTAGQQGCR